MVQFDNESRQIKIKIVYYGPALGGKTTCLQAIHRRADPQRRTKLYSLNTSSDRTLFFDLLALNLGRIRGYQLMVQLYTVPGQVQYSATRKAVLSGVDGLVFVADSQASRLAENRESLEDLKSNLTVNGINMHDLPIVFLYNKQDLSPKIPIATFEENLNLKRRPSFGSVATTGEGVMESFASACEGTLAAVADRLGLRGNTQAIKKLRDQARAALRSLLNAEQPGTDAGDSVVTSPIEGTSPDEPLSPEALVGEAVRANLAMTDLNTRLDALTHLLERKIRVMEEIRVFAETVSSHSDPAAVLRDFLRSALRLIEVASAAVSLVPGTGTLREVVVHGLKRDPLLSSEGEDKLPLAVALLAKRQPILISRDTATESQAAVVDAVEAAGFTSALAVPMLVQEREIGLFTAYTTGDRATLDEDDLHLSSVLAATGAMAYVNAQALRRVEELNRALEAQLDVHKQGLQQTIGELEKENTDLKARSGLVERQRREIEEREQLRSELVRSATANLNDLVSRLKDQEGQGKPISEGPRTGPDGRQTTMAVETVQHIETIAGHLRMVSALTLSEHRPVEVAALIRSAMGPLRDFARLQEVRLSISIASELKHINGDGEALATALHAVVDNGIRYNHRGGEVRLAAKVVDKASAQWVVFTVTDSGVGIPESELANIFRFPTRIVSDSGRGGSGLGADLAVARRVFMNHGGDVKVESWLGRGTAVTLSLPQPH